MSKRERYIFEGETKAKGEIYFGEKLRTIEKRGRMKQEISDERVSEKWSMKSKCIRRDTCT